MSKPNLTEVHAFVIGKLANRIFRLFKSHHIITEGDLQSHVHHMLSSFIKKNTEEHDDYKILNKPYFKELRLFPDVVIFRNNKPWIVFELKEKKSKAKKEKMLLEYRDFRKLKAKNKTIERGYLIYAAIRGTSEPLLKPVADFYEIPIVLEAKIHNRLKLDQWLGKRKILAKYFKED